jgi:NAD(P)-dependent dehydrogenase (short-subunit alcohol dehydrogenase family)
LITKTLTGLSIAVTGGANGIGLAAARGFVAAGSRVAIGDIDADAVTTAAASLNGATIGRRLDVSDRESFATFLDAAEQSHGPLDVLVNNAGIDWIGPFHEEPR